MTKTTKTTLDANYENYVRKRTILDFKSQLTTDVFADKGDRIPRNVGDTIKFIKRLRLARDQTVLTASTQPTAKALYTMDITATAVEYGDRITIERIPDLTAVNLKFTDAASEELADVAARKADYITTDVLAKNAYRIRADGDTTYQKTVTTTSDGNAGGTTFISTSLTESDDHWNGGYATCVAVDTSYAAREAYLETKAVSDFVATSDTVTTGAFSCKIVTGCQMHLCVGTGLVSTDELTTDVFGLAVARLGLNKAHRFQGVAGKNLPDGKKVAGYFGCTIDPHTHYSFTKDTTWVNLGINQIADQLLDGSGVKWHGTKLYGTNQPWREDVDGTENESSGAVHLVHFYAKHAYAVSDVAAEGCTPPYGMKTEYLTAKDLGQSVPRNSEMGFILYFVAHSLDSTSNVAVLCGAPTIG